MVGDRNRKMSTSTRFWLVVISGALAIVLGSGVLYAFAMASDYVLLKNQVEGLVQNSIPEHLAKTDESISNIKENIEQLRHGQDAQNQKLDYIIQHQKGE